MTKECKVILNNEYVTVVKFGDEEVQLPSIRMDAEKVLIQYKDGKYLFVRDWPIETPETWQTEAAREDAAEDKAEEAPAKAKKNRRKKPAEEE